MTRTSRPLAHLAAEFAEALLEPLQLLLITVGTLSAVFGRITDAIAIFAIIAVVAAVESLSEARAERALRSLRSLAAPTASVRRNGAVVRVATSAVVVGDILVLEHGDIVAADGRVIAADGLAVDESALTGEPVSAAKGTPEVLPEAPLAERTSMVYAGTAISSGSGAAVVTAAGDDTQIGDLARLVAEASEPPTPLQTAMTELARAALILAIAASTVVPLIGVLRGQPPRDMLLDGLTLAFATIPEELPILVTVLVAVGGLRLARRGVLLRKLRAAESVGAATVLLTDKTGTLTENKLELFGVFGEHTRTIAVALAAHGGADVQDPLDHALARAGPATAAPGCVQRRFAFDPQRKRESAVWPDGDGDGVRIAVKGAPEAVLERCLLDRDEHAAQLQQITRLAQRGMRVIAVAERRSPSAPLDSADAERDLELVGLTAFLDPLRDGVEEALAQMGTAGGRTIVVSGDHPDAVRATAVSAGLPEPAVLLGGRHLQAMSDHALGRRLAQPLVVARATPEDKLRLVRALQHRGEVVAVTGDGVNDAPALAAADVGIAMGQRGTDLAREASDLVLTDDAYPTIVAAVAGGRGVGAQLRRAVAFYLGAKLALVAVIAAPLALGLASPLKPVQIVLLELFMDLGASVAFVSEPPDPGLMTRPPRDPARRFLDRAQRAGVLLTALALTAAVLPAYLLVDAAHGTRAGEAAAVTAWLLAHVGIAWNLRIRPRLRPRENVAFPAWALAATSTACALAVTPAAGAVGLDPMSVDSIAVTLGASAAGIGLAVLGGRTLNLATRL